MDDEPSRPAPFLNALGQVNEPDYYMMFLNALEGLIDSAEMSGYDADGIAQLREARELFWSDYRILQQSRQEEAAKQRSSGELP